MICSWLVGFVELQLKSGHDFGAAYDIILSTKLSDYMKRYLLLQPGDWPAQFYSRQLVYETLQKYQSHFPSSEPSPGPLTKPTSHLDHSYTTPCNTSGPAKEHDTSNQPTILSIIPCIGPLHISLNARETVFTEFRPFYEIIYKDLFPKSKLAKTPKPWRISLLHEIVYGGWRLISDTVNDKFSTCKDL